MRRERSRRVVVSASRMTNDRRASDPIAQHVRAAEVCLPSRDFQADLAFFTGTLGFRLDTIFPADDPAVATLSGHGLRIRIDRAGHAGPGHVAPAVRDPARGRRGRAIDRDAGRDAIKSGRRVAADGASVDRPRIHGAAPAGRPALGHRPRGHAVSRPDSRAPGRQHHRFAHPHPRRGAGAGHGPLPHRRLPVDLLLHGLGAARLRGSGSAVHPGRRTTASSSRRRSVIACSRRPRICR